MRKLLMTLTLALLATAAMAKVEHDPNVPIITIYTNMYAEDGENNSFTLQIGCTTSSEYIDIDCGYGKMEAELGQAFVDSTGIRASGVECHVSPEGIVRVYGDPTKIDVLNASGCSITGIEFDDELVLDVLNLEHNELKKIDLSKQCYLTALYLYDNPFDEEPLMLPSMPLLRVLEVGQIENISPDFTLQNFPALVSFDAYHSTKFSKVDPTGCPNLIRLSLDMTAVETVDVSKNPKLSILNVNDTRVKSLDLSNNPNIVELYCSHSSGTMNRGVKMESIDVTNCSQLFYFFCAGNNFKELDLSKNTILFTLSANKNQLSSIDLSNNKNLYSVNLSENNMDFATLPLDPGTWYEYYYAQRNLPVKTAYPVGGVLDLSDRVLREGTQTNGVLYAVKQDDPTNYIKLDESYYTYANGKITFLQALDDSVFVSFNNSHFSESDLQTTRFVIKDADEYGKPNAQAVIGTNMDEGVEARIHVGIAGATPANPKKFYVDFGDGTLMPFTTTTSELSDEPNAVAERPGRSSIIVYLEEGDELTALKSGNLKQVTRVDVSAAGSLRYLIVPNADLYSIDLSYNRCLEYLDLSGNMLSTFTQKAPSGYYYKSFLHNINLSNNRLTSYTFDDQYATHNINLSGNKLTEVDFSDADNLVTCDLSNNQFSSLAFTYSSVMTHLNVANNNLTELAIPTDNSLQELNVSGNLFTLANMPDRYELDEAHFIYAPQQNIRIANKGIGADLTAQNVTIDGNATTFAWYDANGNKLTEGTDYTNDGGLMRFVGVPAEKAYCTISNAAYPAFSGANILRTTEIQPIDMPTNLVAQFSTTSDGSAELSLSAFTDNASVYFDWAGNGVLTQYELGTTYRTFSAKTYGGADVKVYTSDDSENLRVLSINGAKIKNFKNVNLKNLYALMLVSADMTSIDLPIMNNLHELNLSGNHLTTIDLSKFANLDYANLCSNGLSSIDLSKNKSLQVAYFTNNNISEVKFNNPNLWGLDLGYNKLESFSFDGLPAIYQISLEGNTLTNIDVENVNTLRVLNLSHNKFLFSTLPLKKENWGVYYFTKQATLDVACVNGRVDLSSEAVIGDTATTYRWFLDEVTINDDGELEGEELVEGTEYIVNNGVTTFLTRLNNVIGVLTNNQFPYLYLYTNPMSVTWPTGIEGIEGEGKQTNSIYDLSGRRLQGKPSKGIYIQGGRKVTVK